MRRFDLDDRHASARGAHSAVFEVIDTWLLRQDCHIDVLVEGTSAFAG
jgi:hypothetical protein